MCFVRVVAFVGEVVVDLLALMHLLVGFGSVLLLTDCSGSLWFEVAWLWLCWRCLILVW